MGKVEKSDEFIDANNLKWNSVDILLSTSESAQVWSDLKFRKIIFSKYLPCGNLQL